MIEWHPVIWNCQWLIEEELFNMKEEKMTPLHGKKIRIWGKQFSILRLLRVKKTKSKHQTHILR